MLAAPPHCVLRSAVAVLPHHWRRCSSALTGPAGALQSEIDGLAADAAALASAHGFAAEDAADVAAAVSESAEALLPAAAATAAEPPSPSSPAGDAIERTGSGQMCGLPCFQASPTQDGDETIEPLPGAAAAEPESADEAAEEEEAAEEAAAAAVPDAAPLEARAAEEAAAAALDAAPLEDGETAGGLLPEASRGDGSQADVQPGSPRAAEAAADPAALSLLEEAAEAAPAVEAAELSPVGSDDLLAGMELVGAAPAAAGSPLSSVAAAKASPAAPPRVDELLEGLSLTDSEEEEEAPAA